MTAREEFVERIGSLSDAKYREFLVSAFRGDRETKRFEHMGRSEHEQYLIRRYDGNIDEAAANMRRALGIRTDDERTAAATVEQASEAAAANEIAARADARAEAAGRRAERAEKRANLAILIAAVGALAAIVSAIAAWGSKGT